MFKFIIQPHKPQIYAIARIYFGWKEDTTFPPFAHHNLIHTSVLSSNLFLCFQIFSKDPIIFFNRTLAVFLLLFLHLEPNQYLTIHQRLPGQKYNIGIGEGNQQRIWEKYVRMWNFVTSWERLVDWISMSGHLIPFELLLLLSVNKNFSRWNLELIGMYPPSVSSQNYKHPAWKSPELEWT